MGFIPGAAEDVRRSCPGNGQRFFLPPQYIPLQSALLGPAGKRCQCQVLSALERPHPLSFAAVNQNQLRQSGKTCFFAGFPFLEPPWQTAGISALASWHSHQGWSCIQS